MAKNNKDSFIIFRVTKQEKDDFVSKAKQSEKTVSNFIRRLLKLDK